MPRLVAHNNQETRSVVSKSSTVLCLVTVALFCIGQLTNSRGDTLVIQEQFHNAARQLQLTVQELGQTPEEKEQSTDENSSTMQERDPWPGLVPSSELGSPLVRIGHSFVDHALDLLLEHWDEFLTVYNNRPDRNNICGMRINHAFGLWITVRQLQPTSIVESGVNAGMSTYLMRHAAPHSTIYAIDPKDKPICNQKERWMDPSNKTVYWTGINFVDLQKVDWQALIDKGEIQPSTTLIFQDDHTNAFEHVLTYMKHGFRHVVMEDNYRTGEGGSAIDRSGYTPKQMLSRTDQDSKFFHSLLEVYAEFPPLFPPSLAENSTAVPYHQLYSAFLTPKQSLRDVEAPLLRPDLRARDEELYQELCRVTGNDPLMGDKYSFFQLYQYVHICYFRLKETASVGPFLASRMQITVPDTVSR